MNTKHLSLSSLAAAVAAVLPTLASAAPPATSAYATDAQSSHVQDATSERIGTVNMITCIMNALAPDLMVNKGNYLALVDENKCNGKKDSVSNSGASGGAADAPSYTSAIVNSTRPTNADPMLAKIWLREDDLGGGGPGDISVRLSATQAPTATNPYGVFRLDFAGRVTGGSTTVMNGMLNAGTSGLQFYQNENRGGGQTQITQLALNATGTSTGSGEVKSVFSNGGAPQTTDFTFAYDASYFRRSDGTVNGDQCFSRDATAAGTGYSVWRYGLYDATTGDRVDMAHPGFPITYTDPSSGTVYQGYLGYWGLSLPPAAQALIGTGSTIAKANYGGNGAATQTNYSVVKAGGKLTKYTRQTRSLQSLDQIRFNTWYGSNTPLYNGAPLNTQFEMYWDDMSQLFVVSGIMNCSNNGCQTVSLPNPQPTVSAAVWQSVGGISGWSNTLGGELFIDLVNPGAQSSLINVVYRVQDTVYPNAMPANLYCIDNCPTAASIQGYFAPNSVATSPYTGATFGAWGTIQPAGVVSYTTDTTTGLLSDANTAAVIVPANANISQSSPYQNGVRSGRMVDTLASAECSLNSNTYCESSISLAQVYYVWETGPNSWNQFVGVKNGSQFVTIDPPMQLNYSVPNDAVAFGDYAGKTIVLQYSGFGQLNGIPGTCVSQVDNLPVPCNTANARWVPQFAIPLMDPSTQLPTTVSSGSTTYLVKWLDREIRFAQLPLATCTGAGLTLPTGLTLPLAASAIDPSDPASANYIGVKPTVTAPAEVIQGVVQY